MLIPSRRKFLRIGCRSLGMLGAASLVGRFGRVNALAATACPTDYKALVCVFLFGGNDGNNTLIPISTPSNPANSYSTYAQVRAGLALPQAGLNVIGNSKGDQFGLHPNLTELAALYNNKQVAVLTNVGTLVTPLTQNQYKNQLAAIPSNLFSHLDQQTEWQTALAQGAGVTGWGGRVADAIQGCNTAGFPTILSVGGNALFATGAQTSPATANPGQILGLQGFSTSAASAARRAALQDLLTFDNGVTLVQASNTIATNGVNQANFLNEALAGGKALTTVFPNTSLGQQLAQVAKIINVRVALGMRRQIFFAYLGGFSGSCGGRGGSFDAKTSCSGAFADPAAFNKKVKVLFLGIGSVEGPGTKNFSDELTKAGIHNVYFESPGTAHEWLTWRRCLNDFAPMLFR